MSVRADQASPLERYTYAAQLSSGRIIGVYSTSFGTATRLLGTRHRAHVRNIYALVRVADELVDGATVEAGMDARAQRRTLDRLESDTEDAISSGYSSNPIVHAFAHTARAARFGTDLTRPFFASMRTDLTDAAQDDSSVRGFGPHEHTDYVYGSAEVVGLMCLRVFTRESALRPDDEAHLTRGARSLGAAFQNVNFLRDLADDTDRLGRSYLSARERLDGPARDRWLTTIEEQLDDAARTLPLLPADARLAVASALELFRALAGRIARTPIEDLYRRRVRVTSAQKALIIAKAAVRSRRRGAQ